MQVDVSRNQPSKTDYTTTRTRITGNSDNNRETLSRHQALSNWLNDKQSRKTCETLFPRTMGQ